MKSAGLSLPGASTNAGTLDASSTGLTAANGAFIPIVGLDKGVTRPVKSSGKIVANFASGVWVLNSGTGTLTQGYTGYDVTGAVTGIASRSGQPSMLKITPADNTTTEIRLASVATNLKNAALGGKFGLWVYAENLPGCEQGGAGPAMQIGVTLTTNAGASNTNALYVAFNSNQVREGWNFLKFRMRNPLAYAAGQNQTEYHPFGISCTGYGTGVDTDIVNSNITGIKIAIQNTSGTVSNTNLYFDSMWTGQDSFPQIVLGTDSAGTDLTTYALPIFKQYGWVGYVAVPRQIWTYGTNGTNLMVADFSSGNAQLAAAYAAGWDCINHTTNHLPMAAAADATNAKNPNYMLQAQDVAYELLGVQGMYANNQMTRGAEFYASPQSSTSRLTETVIKGLGFKLQRHSRKGNVTITSYGLDNPNHVGSSDIGSIGVTGVSVVTNGANTSIAGWQKASQIKRMVDVIIDYGDTWFPFWHGITTTATGGVADDGMGEQLTGDNLLITYSAFAISCAYIRAKELAGLLRVCKGMTGFYYGRG